MHIGPINENIAIKEEPSGDEEGGDKPKANVEDDEETLDDYCLAPLISLYFVH